MTADRVARCAYVDATGCERRVELPCGANRAIERAHVELTPCDAADTGVDAAADCVIEARSGVLEPWQLVRLDDALAAARPAWLYFPRERALESVDAERLAFHRRLRRVARVAAPLAALAPARSHAAPLPRRDAGEQRRASGLARIDTGDEYKDAAQDQWDFNPAGSHYAAGAPPHTRAWFEAIERHRYCDYAPWMPRVMEFDRHAGEDVLEIGGGIGTDLSRFARGGARVADVDLSRGHLRLAEENFAVRGLSGRFVHHDAERLPFDDRSFDLVYTNGVLHHTPDTARLVGEIHRVLRPGGRVIAMVYAEPSFHFWYRQVLIRGLIEGRLSHTSIGGVLSETVEVADNDARPLVKVYSRERLRRLFAAFDSPVITQHQLTAAELPLPLRPLRGVLERRAGWNLVIKAIRR